MENYRLSSKAEHDLANIYEYTIVNFGVSQARKYFAELQDILSVLSERKELYRETTFFDNRMYYYNFKAHTIFFIVDQNIVFVVRILGQTMDYKRHL